jgi:CRP-like cAMP-binding protein
MFAGLNDHQIAKLAAVFDERTLHEGEVLFSQGDEGDSLCLIREGFVEVVLEENEGERVLVNLGPGQSVGEMSLIDLGKRSASVRAVVDHTVVALVTREAFDKLCQENTDIGFLIMRNIAADLSFRLRRRDLSA